MDERSVLVCDGKSGRTRDSVVTVRALAAAGYQVTVPVDPKARYLSRHIARRLPIGELGDDGFIDALTQEIAAGGHCAFIPASENISLALSDEVPPLLEKRSLRGLALRAGLSVPDEVAFESVEEMQRNAGSLPFPVVVKPAVRRFTAFVATEPSGLTPPDSARDFGALVVQPFVEGAMTAVAGVMYAGRLHSAAHELWHRLWPTRCGLASYATSCGPDAELEDRLEMLLADHEGVFVAQFVGGRLIDVNLRAHSSLPLSVASGVNLPAIYADLRRGLAVAPARSEAGHRFRWLAGDTKAIVWALRNRRMSPAAALTALVPRPGTVHSMFAWNDLGPFIARAGSYRR